MIITGRFACYSEIIPKLRDSYHSKSIPGIICQSLINGQVQVAASLRWSMLVRGAVEGPFLVR